MTSTPPRISSPRSASRTQHRRGRILHGRDCSFFAATLGTVGAAASFYGGGVTPVDSDSRPWWNSPPTSGVRGSGLYGDLDQSIPVDQVEALREATNAAPVADRDRAVPEGQHGFHCDARPDSFNEAAATDARGRALAFFAEHLSDNSQLRGTSFQETSLSLRGSPGSPRTRSPMMLRITSLSRPRWSSPAFE